MEAIVAIAWLVTTRTLRSIDHLLFRRRLDSTSPPRLDSTSPPLSRLLHDPADFLADDEYVVGPFRRRVTCLVLGMTFAMGGMLLTGVVLLVLVAGLYAALTGHTIWDDADGIALRSIVIGNAVLEILCIPAGIWFARRVLQGGQFVIQQDGVLLEWKSDAVFCPWQLWLAETECSLDAEASRDRVCFLIPPGSAFQVKEIRRGQGDPGLLKITGGCVASLADVFCVSGEELIQLARGVAFRLQSDGRLS